MFYSRAEVEAAQRQWFGSSTTLETGLSLSSVDTHFSRILFPFQSIYFVFTLLQCSWNKGLLSKQVVVGLLGKKDDRNKARHKIRGVKIQVSAHIVPSF